MSNKMRTFIEEIAALSLPEEEFEREGYSDVEDYVSDLSDERLGGEYSTFMDFVRDARNILKD